MDAKITKERLNRILSYDWLKIVGLAVVSIIVWTLVFTTSATRITPAQQFTVINYFGNVSTLHTTLSTDVNKAFQDGTFSYEVIEISDPIDVGGNAEMGATLMNTRVATEEGDVVFVPNIENADSEYVINGEKYRDTYLQGLIRGYRWALHDLDRASQDGYFGKLENFLNRYYTNGYENEALNEEKIKQDFLTRIQENKDKRFKKDEQIQKGIQDEIARVKKYRDALIEFDGYLESGLVELTHTIIANMEKGETVMEGVYSINICPNPEKMPNLNKIVAYEQEVKNEAGEVQAPKFVAKDMNVAIMKFDGMEESFEYEGLLYVNHVIRMGKATV